MAGGLFIVAQTEGNAGTMGPIASAQGRPYVGVFGGAGGSTHVDIHQYGTAFFTEAAGGPLAVDSFGSSNSRTVGLVGAQVGYQWLEIPTSLFGSSALLPAAELEGYYLGKSSFTTHDINNNTERLPEHDFLVNYPMKSGVFLVNAVLAVKTQSRIQPYIGAGIGGAVLSISNASSEQVAPPEVGVNHYSAHTSDSDATFAAQGKVGLNFNLTPNVDLFAEYRGLYLASSSYTFGSTVAPGHAATSSWQVEMGSQYYNTGAVGIRYIV